MVSQLENYVSLILKDEQNSHGYRAQSAFSMLNHVELMIDRYLEENHQIKGAILLDVFGLLQGLFVGVDALYDLAIGLTQYKYHINVNSNPILHELKYIRNDIVGHPTHRTYPNGGMGFSLLSTDQLSKTCFHYKTYIFEKNKLEIKSKEVLIHPLIEAYRSEKHHILSGLLSYLKHRDLKITLSDDIYLLYETINQDMLNDIKKRFIETYEIDEKMPHRFLWRIELVNTLIGWEEEDKDLNLFLLYLSKVQVAKMYEIALHMENHHGKDLYTPIPPILKSFYKFILRNEKMAISYLKNLHDQSHPLHETDIAALRALEPKTQAAKLIDFLDQQTEESKVYLIGSALRNYRPKQ